MKKNPFHHPVLLIAVFMLLQLGGQISAGLAGGSEGTFNVFTLVSYTALVMRSLVWIMILKKLPLTYAYPFTGVIYLLILPLSALVFGDQPGWSRYAGALLIFAGIVLGSLGRIRRNV